MRTLAPQSDQSSIIQYEQFHSTVMSTRWVYTCGRSQSPSVIVKRLKKMTPPKKDTFDPTEGFPSSLFLGILISSCCSCLDYRFTLGSSARRHLPLWSCEDSETLCPPPRQGGGRGCAAATEVTLSQERSSFDLIIWEGQSAFVDEESLWYVGVGKSMGRTEPRRIDRSPAIDNPWPG